MLKTIGVGDNVIEIYSQNGVMYPGGNALNFSVFSRQLGHQSAFLGAFGSDVAAMHIKTVLMNLEIDLSHSKNYTGRSREATVDIIQGERLFTNTPEDEKSALNKVVLNYDDYNYLKEFDIVHTDIISDMETQLVRMHRANPILSFDFSDRWNDENLKTICPYVYLSFLSCENMDIVEIEEVLKKAHGYGSKLCLAGMGSEGALLFDGKRLYRRKAIDVQLIDSLGAGSAFVTCFFTEFIYKMKKENENINLVFQEIREDIIDEALSSAIFFAAKICEQDGPFGFPIDIKDEEEKTHTQQSLKKKLVLGVIGADVHAVGNKILEFAFTEAGFDVTNLGVMVSQEEFVDAAIETSADAIIVSSLYGHGELDCRGLREKCIEAGLENILLYVGGNLVVGVQQFDEVEKKFKEMGFDRVYDNTSSAADDIRDLKIDLQIS